MSICATCTENCCYTHDMGNVRYNEEHHDNVGRWFAEGTLVHHIRYCKAGDDWPLYDVTNDRVLSRHETIDIAQDALLKLHDKQEGDTRMNDQDKTKCPACEAPCQLWRGGECVEGHCYVTPGGSPKCRPQEVSFVPLKPVCDGFFDVCDTLEAINVRLGRIEARLREQGASDE